jgi:hypothetical protein
LVFTEIITVHAWKDTLSIGKSIYSQSGLKYIYIYIYKLYFKRHMALRKTAGKSLVC